MGWLRVYPLILQFSVGAIMCAVGVWCGLSSGYFPKGDPSTRRMLIVVIGGYLALLTLACLFTFVLPYAGEAPGS